MRRAVRRAGEPHRAPEEAVRLGKQAQIAMDHAEHIEQLGLQLRLAGQAGIDPPGTALEQLAGGDLAPA
jgi:hypothetical protein